jgi:hypothetical protein
MLLQDGHEGREKRHQATSTNEVGAAQAISKAAWTPHHTAAVAVGGSAGVPAGA